MDRRRAYLRVAPPARRNRANRGRSREEPDRRATAPDVCRVRARSAPSGPLWLILLSWLPAYRLFTCHPYIRATITIKFTTPSWSTEMSAALPDIRCRQIEENDVPAVAGLLTRGF